jgi:hypothetical protein
MFPQEGEHHENLVRGQKEETGGRESGLGVAMAAGSSNSRAADSFPPTRMYLIFADKCAAGTKPPDRASVRYYSSTGLPIGKASHQLNLGTLSATD